MTVDTDDNNLILLINECFRNTLRRLIRIVPVLDHITFLEREQKERIINKARNDCNQTAVDLLIDTIVAGPRQPGWSREFVDALLFAGCTYAAQIVGMEKLPSPSLEAENDCCVKLIEIMGPSLLAMKTTDVCETCYQSKLITELDRQNILAETTNNGPMAGARLLLHRIVLRPPGWFSDFLEVLNKTEHADLVAELTGTKPGKGADESPPESSSSDESTGQQEEERDGEGERKEKQGEKEQEEVQEEEQEEVQQRGTLSTEGGDNINVAPDVCVVPKVCLMLRPYQLTVAQPALQGANSIVCLPTGSGKTCVAVYVAKEHLDRRRQQGAPGKTVVIVNKVVLVEQHFIEFGKYLKENYRLEQVSGDSPNRQAFANTLTGHDIIICTAQILLNALLDTEDGISLSDITLLVVDECHHTHKGDVYQQIMVHYLGHKMANMKRKKMGKDVMLLPQILGLTASPGVGKAKNREKAQKHIIKICANLDASVLMTAPLGEHSQDRQKDIIMAERRTQDPFGDVIRHVMQSIQEHAQLKPSVETGTQRYEQWVVEEEKHAAKHGNQRRRACAEYLRQYNEALILSNTIRMCDAYHLLSSFYHQERRKKEGIAQTHTDNFLFKLFHDSQRRLEDFSKQPEYENNVLSELRTVILKKFSGPDEEVRGIIFTETRLSAQALHSWIQENSKFADMEVRSSYLIGAGDQSAVKPMTASEQRDAIRKFNSGEVNLLIATTVAEEGLDIQKCNIVIRYCLVTSEIAMIQARGRGRADGSSYIVIGVEGSGVAERERLNEWKENLMQRAIQGVQQMDEATYKDKVMGDQLEALMEKKLRQRKSDERVRRLLPPSAVKFRCRGCEVVACEGTDIEVIEDAHHVNLTEDFRSKFNINANSSYGDGEMTAHCEAEKYMSCKKCGEFWGPEMCHRLLECPCLSIRGFVVMQGARRETLESWTDLPVQFPEFNYCAHASEFVGDETEDI
ncbi:interferon-induced helicase C domain-containing protein 1-like [Alosa sapidissima]|uniref:interferon-induced helicase C domain-containing protein 1-like n=1 Tax=Alosa sapidissima TaxID=34773 RepID=UPI001C07F483|nr:interferon-induced helicase C domain-containing protein 1-like [Alosa sapidissima]